MTSFLGPAWGLDGEPFLVEALGGKGFPRARERQRTRVVVDDFGNAVCYQRRCPNCRRWLPLGFAYFGANRRGSKGMEARCNECNATVRRMAFRRDPESKLAANRAWYAAWKERDPEAYAAFLRRCEKGRRRRMERDPEGERRRYREAQRRKRQRRDADPKRRAEFLEFQRIDNKLRNLDAGKALRPPRQSVDERMGRLPVGPLLAAIEGWLDGRDLEEVGAFLDPRNLRGWRNGEYDTTPFDVADRVLIGIDLLWWEVWREGEEGYERACELFTGEAVAA